MILILTFASVVIAPAIYDAIVADPKDAVAKKIRMNAVENAGVLHSKLTGGRF